MKSFVSLVIALVVMLSFVFQAEAGNYGAGVQRQRAFDPGVCSTGACPNVGASFGVGYAPQLQDVPADVYQETLRERTIQRSAGGYGVGAGLAPVGYGVGFQRAPIFRAPPILRSPPIFRAPGGYCGGVPVGASFAPGYGVGYGLGGAGVNFNFGFGRQRFFRR